MKNVFLRLWQWSTSNSDNRRKQEIVMTRIMPTTSSNDQTKEKLRWTHEEKRTQTKWETERGEQKQGKIIQNKSCVQNKRKTQKRMNELRRKQNTESSGEFFCFFLSQREKKTLKRMIIQHIYPSTKHACNLNRKSILA